MSSDMDKIERVLKVLQINEKCLMRLQEQHAQNGWMDLAKFELAEALAIRKFIFMLTDDDYLADMEDLYVGGDQE